MIKRSTAKDLKKQIEFLYDTADVSVSYSYWFNKLLALTLTMFDYKGLPESLLEKHYDECVRIPMMEETRSLNLSNSVCVGVYEALRQNGYKGMLTRGEIPKK